MKKILFFPFLLGLLSFSLMGCQTKKTSPTTSTATTEATSSNQTKDSKQSSDSEQIIQADLLANDPVYGQIAKNTGAKKARITDEAEYQIEWQDASWAGVNVAIDQMAVIKVADYHDDAGHDYQGFVILHYVISSPEKAVNLHPEQAKLTTNTGESSHGNYELGHFAGEIKPGEKVAGSAAYPLKKLTDAKEINRLEMSFTGNYHTDDADDQNAKHTYQLILK